MNIRYCASCCIDSVINDYNFTDVREGKRCALSFALHLFWIYTRRKNTQPNKVINNMV